MADLSVRVLNAGNIAVTGSSLIGGALRVNGPVAASQLRVATGVLGTDGSLAHQLSTTSPGFLAIDSGLTAGATITMPNYATEAGSATIAYDFTLKNDSSHSATIAAHTSAPTGELPITLAPNAEARVLHTTDGWQASVKRRFVSQNAQAATSATTGAIQCAGGLGIGGSAFVGGAMTVGGSSLLVAGIDIAPTVGTNNFALSPAMAPGTLSLRWTRLGNLALIVSLGASYTTALMPSDSAISFSLASLIPVGKTIVPGSTLQLLRNPTTGARRCTVDAAGTVTFYQDLDVGVWTTGTAVTIDVFVLYLQLE